MEQPNQVLYWKSFSQLIWAVLETIFLFIKSREESNINFSSFVHIYINEEIPKLKPK